MSLDQGMFEAAFVGDVRSLLEKYRVAHFTPERTIELVQHALGVKETANTGNTQPKSRRKRSSRQPEQPYEQRGNLGPL